jgi:anti-anti-sigma factor
VPSYQCRLVLDLSGVMFMDCTGINLLLATWRRARLAGGWLQVINAAPAATTKEDVA